MLTFLKVPYRSYLMKQLTICVDIYLEILDVVDRRIQLALKRDMPLWRLKHACPTCTYELHDELPLHFKMLFTMDGNDSLKRVDRSGWDLGPIEEGLDGELLCARHELTDSQEVRGDYYLTRSQVEIWRERGSLLSAPATIRFLPLHYSNLTNFCFSIDFTFSQESQETHTECSPCTEWWKNMSDQLTSKAWSIFDETGVFVAICRHGFVLTIADMVKSGKG